MFSGASFDALNAVRLNRREIGSSGGCAKGHYPY